MVEAVGGDLTRERVDAVVNAANSTLLGGGGVDGALHAAAGPALLEECRRLRSTTHREGLAVGDAVATGAGALPARWVIHTVGPNRHAGQTNRALLVSCFSESLRLADSLAAGTLAFPAVGAGAYGWPAAAVAQAALDAVVGFRATHPASRLELVEFVLHTGEAETVFRDVLEPLR